MAQLHSRADVPYRDPAEGERWGGWVVFAALMLSVNGCMNMFQGLVALFDDGYFKTIKDGDLLLVDFTAWGIVQLLWGALLLVAGVGLFGGKSWARWMAIVVAGTSILTQIGFLNALPIWSLIIIAFDVVVLFALTARWDAARRTLQ